MGRVPPGPVLGRLPGLAGGGAATPATVDPGLAYLASVGLTSSAAVQQALNVARCAANIAACEALGGGGDPSTPSNSAAAAPCTGFPCASDYTSCAQQPTECSSSGAGGQQPLSCAMEGKGCQQGNTMPYAPGDSPWDPHNYTNPGPMYPLLAALHVTAQCAAALGLGAYDAAGTALSVYETGLAEPPPYGENIAQAIAESCFAAK